MCCCRGGGPAALAALTDGAVAALRGKWSHLLRDLGAFLPTSERGWYSKTIGYSSRDPSSSSPGWLHEEQHCWAFLSNAQCVKGSVV
jgi:hypothetical protein